MRRRNPQKAHYAMQNAKWFAIMAEENKSGINYPLYVDLLHRALDDIEAWDDRLLEDYWNEYNET